MPAPLALPAPARLPGDRWSVLRGTLVLLYFALFSLLSIQTWAAYTRYDADLAINDQLVWTASRFRPFQSTLIGHTSVSLGDHFAFFQLYLAPLYWIWPDPRTLLLAQSAGLALAALPVGWTADQRLNSRPLGTAVVAAFLLYPPLHFLNLFEYHEVAWAVPTLALFFWALTAQKMRLAWLFFGLSLTVKEEMAIVGAAIGLYVAVIARQWRTGLAMTALSVLWGILAMGIIMPRLTAAGSEFYYVRRYSHYGDSLGAIALALATQPWLMLADLIGPGRPTYYLQLLLPLAGLPLLAPAAFALALPTLGYLALGNSPAQYSILYHYQAPLIPLLLFATIAGMARLVRWGVPRAAVAALLLGAAAGAYLLLSPAPLGRAFEPERYHGGEHAAILDRFVAAVPPDTPVSAARNVVSRFSRRERVYNFPTIADAEIVLLDYRGYVCCGFWEDDDHALRRFVADPAFWLVDAADGVWLFQRGTPRPPTIQHPAAVDIGGQIRLSGHDLTPLGNRRYELTLWWQALRPPDDRYTVFVHVLDADGRRVWQHDSEPLDGLFPTTDFPPGRFLPDRRRLDLGGLPAGEYRVYIGMYVWGGGDRLPIPVTAGTEFPDAYLLTRIALPPA
ncbi:MAG: DUF2079 domain-containing protein [Chloroflexota bacterium]|nr:DUF2079 domain-containing protein [Dehalococcoidia bacterium]MDW8254472.1 DUF2079 domain-containing protein [Chloroflexota bacterium]